MSALDLEQGEIGIGTSYWNRGTGIAIGFAVPLGISSTFSLKAGSNINDFDDFAVSTSLKYKF